MAPFKKKVITEVSLALAIIGALGAGIVFFGVNINKSTVAISETLRELITRSGSLRLLAVLQTQYSTKAAGYSEVLNSFVPPKDALINLSKDFEIMAARRNLGFGFSFLGENAPDRNGLGSVSFGLNIQAQSFDDLVRFMSDLQNFKYFNKINGFNFGREGSSYNLSIKGQVYFRQSAQNQ